MEFMPGESGEETARVVESEVNATFKSSFGTRSVDLGRLA